MLRFFLFLALQSTNTESPPDGWFYYAFSLFAIGLISFIVWFAINRYLSKQEARDDKVDSTLVRIGETLAELKTSNTLTVEQNRHNEKRLDQHDKLFEGIVKKLKI